MRLSKIVYLLGLVGAPLVTLTACSDTDEPLPSEPLPDSGVTPTPDIDAGSPPVPTASIRLAHLSPDAPAVRVCLATSDGTFTDQEQPITPALSFAQIGSYATLPTGDFKVRVVGGSDTSCATPLVPSLADVTLPTLEQGEVVTVAAIGRVADLGAATGVQIVFYSDLAERPADGTANVRFIHAAPGTPVPVFVGAIDLNDEIVASFFNAVGYGTTDAEYDANFGYAPLDTALTRVRLGASDAATGQARWGSNALVENGLGSRNYTAFAIDRGPGAAEWQIDVLMVDDTATGAGALNDTAVILPSLDDEIID